MTETPLEIRAVTPRTWSDFERLFESKGAPKYCWCMAWRASTAELKHAKPADRKRQIHERVRAEVPVGILGYQGSEPVAWCSVAPRSTFRGLASDAGEDEGVWSITCFFVRRPLRHAGLARAMLAGAVEHAQRHGARIVEGYPVDPESPSYRYMGFVSMFAEAGFVEVGREGTRRHRMQLRLDAPPARARRPRKKA
ncbi:MAG TPA: GNAT family N-acetyltransferase [Gammaproteobacteria bacterium]